MPEFKGQRALIGRTSCSGVEITIDCAVFMISFTRAVGPELRKVKEWIAQNSSKSDDSTGSGKTA